MVELADIVRLHGPDYLARHQGRMPSSHARAMRDIERCRTPALGGEVFFCGKCRDYRYSYHSCKNRHCPKCQNDEADDWLDRQRRLLLPVTFFLVTFTLPKGVRSLARSRQKIVYSSLFRAAAASLQKLAEDPRHVGGLPGMVAILHTWARNLGYHVHVHFLVTGGGLSPDGSTWMNAQNNFLVPVKALSRIFRAKFRAELKKAGLLEQVDPSAWKQDWVVHSKPVGSGEHVLKYLAPYVFRVAISNRRIESLDNDGVTYKYKESGSGKWKRITVPAGEFLRRFLQHVLPRGFIKVRYYGLFNHKNRRLLKKARYLLGAANAPAINEPANAPAPKPCLCPKCGGIMCFVEIIRPGHIRSP
jgi:hypothetical protein